MAGLVLVVLAFQVVPRAHVEIVATAASAGRAAGGEIKRQGVGRNVNVNVRECAINRGSQVHRGIPGIVDAVSRSDPDRKSTRLNSSHTVISYAVFCLKKK